MLSLFTGALIAFGIGSIFILATGINPIDAYLNLYAGAFGSSYMIMETLRSATPLLLIAVGCCISQSVNIFNIGNEGQMVMGMLIAGAIAIYFENLPSVVLIPAMAIGSCLIAIAYGVPVAIYEIKMKNAGLISSVMLTFIANYIFFLVLRGPLRDPHKSSIESKLITTSAWLPRLDPRSNLNAGFVIAILIGVIGYIFMKKTSLGYQMRVSGFNKKAASYAGISTGKLMILSMVINGGLSGLAGWTEVAGAQHQLIPAMQGPYGFSAVLVALLAKQNPLAAIPASILYGALLNGAYAMQYGVGVPMPIISVIQVLIVLCVIASDNLIFKRFKVVA